MTKCEMEELRKVVERFKQDPAHAAAGWYLDGFLSRFTVDTEIVGEPPRWVSDWGKPGVPVEVSPGVFTPQVSPDPIGGSVAVIPYWLDKE